MMLAVCVCACVGEWGWWAVFDSLTLTVQTHVRIHNPQGLAATVTLAFMSTSPDVVLCDTRGMLTEETLYACLDLGRKACSKIHAFFRLSVQKRLEKGV